MILWGRIAIMVPQDFFQAENLRSVLSIEKDNEQRFDFTQ